jgi:hypothetical protein
MRVEAREAREGCCGEFGSMEVSVERVSVMVWRRRTMSFCDGSVMVKGVCRGRAGEP